MASTTITHTFHAYCMPSDQDEPYEIPPVGLVSARTVTFPFKVFEDVPPTTWLFLLYDRKLTEEEALEYKMIPLRYDISPEKTIEMEAKT